MRAKSAQWRDKNRDYLRAKSKQRRLEKRAMCLVAAARVRARKKGIRFSLTSSDVQRLQDVIDRGRCELTGVRFSLEQGRCATNPSLDRIIPSAGYVQGNVRVVCQAMNLGMGDWGENILLEIVMAWIEATHYQNRLEK
jgi:hypothetical protein